MIKKENIKDAIDAIAGRDPAAGYSLDEMLGAGHIDVPSPQDDSSARNHVFFLFSGRKVPVNKFVFFNEGTTPIEQALLVKYGELVKKEELKSSKSDAGYRDMAQEIHQEGLRFMVCHEIDYAIGRVKKRPERTREFRVRFQGNDRGTGDKAAQDATVTSCLKKIKHNNQPVNASRWRADSAVWYQGIVGSSTDAYFATFPYCMASLIQVADLNLGFFHVRFLLNCLIRGLENNLFVCLVGQQIVGIVFIGVDPKPFYSEIEIKYIATIFGSPNSTAIEHYRSLKGIGTFLVSGVWLLGKTKLGGMRAIFLDSEIEAREFYKSLGFKSHGLAGYVLKWPKGYLFRAILIMANNARRLKKGAARDINSIIKKQVKSLRKEASTEKEKSSRNITVASIRECLKPNSNPEFSRTAMRALLKYRERIPESDDLVQYGLAHVPAIREPAKKRQPVLVIQDEQFKLHLKNVPHLENARRIKATNALLQHPSLHGRWLKVKPRLASEEELGLVHTPEYIRRVAESKRKPLTSFDLDTQATEGSYEVARLAAGGVFCLLDEIWSARGKRGFAFVRPPGHHAGADKAMGFCLFNNVALGARYLIERLQAEKVMIVDIDVHHGNGTQAIFYDTDQVLYTSLHQFPSYPGTGNLGEVGRGKGEGFTVNIPLRKGYGDREICRIIHFIINPLAREYGPDMILVSCGFDLYAYDRLGSMKVTPGGYALITSLLVEIADKTSDGRIAFVMEGGYSLEGIRECGLRVMQELCEVETLEQKQIDQIKHSTQSKLSFLEKATEIHKKYWKILR